MTYGQGYGQQDQPWQPRYDPREHERRLGAPQGRQWPQPAASQPPRPDQQPAHLAQAWPPPYAPQPQYRPQPAPAPRKLPPYPAHLVRFPSGMLPRSRRRRRHSVGHYVYMGTHPVAMLITLYIDAMIIFVVVGWLVFVAVGWMMWAMLVTMAWLVKVAADALRR
jgi:hypothetical protein